MTDYTELAKDKIETMKMLAAILMQANKSETEPYYELGKLVIPGPEKWQKPNHVVDVCNPISKAMEQIDEEIYLGWIDSFDIEWTIEEINKERQAQHDFQAAGCQHTEEYPCCNEMGGNEEEYEWCEWCIEYVCQTLERKKQNNV
tara:strand:+ start:7328 stop:7762 length:435 start_codon:yes stop_codon:yes gene_type:complete